MKKVSRILAVDHNRRNLEILEQVMGKEGFQTLVASSLEEFDQALAGEEVIGLALVDIAGFDRHIWERCQRLREHRVPFLVLSPRQSVAIQQASVTYGARGVLVNPVLVKELLGLIHSFLEEDA